MQVAHTQMVGWGADARPEDRPGVPQEILPPRPVGDPSWRTPPQQHSKNPSAVAQRRGVTPVSGPPNPPRAQRGLVRSVA